MALTRLFAYLLAAQYSGALVLPFSIRWSQRPAIVMSRNEDLSPKVSEWQRRAAVPLWRRAVVPLICALVATSPMQTVSAQAITPPAVTSQMAHPSRVRDLNYASSVDDRAGVIDVDSARAIKQIIDEADERFGSEVVVLTLDSIQGGKPAAKSFATAVFNKWGVGSAERNNGVLVLFSKHDRRIEIAVGKSLNHLMSNTWTTNMLADDVLPILKKGDYGMGLARATRRILQRLEKGDAGAAADKMAQQYANVAVIGGGVSMLIYASVQADRKLRTCEECGAIVPEKDVSGWVTVKAATDRHAGLKERKLSCKKCGTVTRKTNAIPQYDGVDIYGNYYYESSSSDDGDYGSGSSDGGGGGGGDF